jgi:hypothetical protein
MFSLYVQNYHTSNKLPINYLQIGGFDLNAFKMVNGTHSYTLMQSVYKNKWQLLLTTVKFNSHTALGISSQVEFDPSLPFMYVPKKDWDGITSILQ